MATVALIAVALVALLHLYFLVLEMFLWDKPQGMVTTITTHFTHGGSTERARLGA